MAATKTHTDKKTTCKPKPCPTCGSLECIERPRFFCGQLLTDKDLDSAQQYVIEKTRLHNRHVVGSGVVCGLPVRCDPCNGVVVIEPGYAIDCCGNDIVVCDPHRFDVIDYLRKCFRDDEPPCEGKIRPPRPRCDDRPREYCLIISYNEEHTRPVTALIRNSGCSTTRCEPSRTKEIFRVDLIEAPEKDREFEWLCKQTGDNFWSRIFKCIEEVLLITRWLFDRLDGVIDNNNLSANHALLLDTLCRLEDRILKLYREGHDIRCTLPEELAEIEATFPASPQDPQYDNRVYSAYFRMYARLLQFMIDCVCDAMLVPCTECGEQEGVLIACVTVHNGKIEKICNVVRKQVLTGPALRYYLQPIYLIINRALEYLCCELDLGETFDRIFRIREPQDATGVPGTAQPIDGPFFVNSFRTGATRGKVAIDAVQNYSAEMIRSIRVSNLIQLTDPNVVTALDVFNLPVSEARVILERRGLAVVEKRAATKQEAYRIGNLGRMSWIIPAGSQVELITDPEARVTAVRVVEGDRK